MIRWLVRIVLLLVLITAGGLLFWSPYQTWKVEQVFQDQFLEIGPDAALQAGFVRTLHEQRWGSHAFFHIFGLTLPRGYTEARIRAPVRVIYGVRPEHLHVISIANGALTVRINRVDVLNVETESEGFEIETKVGWARLDAVSGEEARKAAKRAFDRTKYRAARDLLLGRDVTENVRLAIQKFAAPIAGVQKVYIVRMDVEQARPAAQEGNKGP